MLFNSIENYKSASNSNVEDATGLLKLYGKNGFSGESVGYKTSTAGDVKSKDGTAGLSIEEGTFDWAGFIRTEFDQEIEGLVLNWVGGSSYNRYTNIILNTEYDDLAYGTKSSDGINIQEAIDSGIITIITNGNAYKISDDGYGIGGNVGGNIQIIINVPVTSVTLRGQGSSNIFGSIDRHYWDIGFDENTSLASICIANGTWIKTINGNVLIENLQAGDMVLTLDKGYQQVRWVGYYDVKFRDAQDRRRPIELKKSALAPNVPSKTTQLSPLHMVFVRSKICERMFGSAEMLIASKKMAGIHKDFVINQKIKSIRYYQILLDDHEIIFANDMPVETLRLGEYSIVRLPKSLQDRLKAQFPNMEKYCMNFTPARPIMQSRKNVKNFVRRHIKNGKPLFEVKSECAKEPSNELVYELKN